MWFENCFLGVNKLGSMIKDLKKAANHFKVFTNRFIRATAMTLWSEATMGDKNVETLCHFGALKANFPP